MSVITEGCEEAMSRRSNSYPTRPLASHRRSLCPSITEAPARTSGACPARRASVPISGDRSRVGRVNRGLPLVGGGSASQSLLPSVFISTLTLGGRPCDNHEGPPVRAGLQQRSGTEYLPVAGT